MNGHEVPSEQRFCGECGAEVVAQRFQPASPLAQAVQAVGPASPRRVLPPPKGEPAIRNPVQPSDLFTKVALAAIGGVALIFIVVALAGGSSAAPDGTDDSPSHAASITLHYDNEPCWNTEGISATVYDENATILGAVSSSDFKRSDGGYGHGCGLEAKLDLPDALQYRLVISGNGRPGGVADQEMPAVSRSDLETAGWVL
jgi:hypothetical protein